MNLFCLKVWLKKIESYTIILLHILAECGSKISLKIGQYIYIFIRHLGSSMLYATQIDIWEWQYYSH